MGYEARVGEEEGHFRRHRGTIRQSEATTTYVWLRVRAHRYTHCPSWDTVAVG